MQLYGHYAIPFWPSKSKQIFVRDLISLFFLTHENDEIKSPMKIYDFTVYNYYCAHWNFRLFKLFLRNMHVIYDNKLNGTPHTCHLLQFHFLMTLGVELNFIHE